jgi:hypothetical protein
MIDYQWDQSHSILQVRSRSPLATQDFAELARTVDPQIAAGTDLAGLIIDAPDFPGWESFGALVTHIRFVHDHHKHVKKIAVVTDSHIGDFAQHLASHFVAAQIREFPAGQIVQAREWITGTPVG